MFPMFSLSSATPVSARAPTPALACAPSSSSLRDTPAFGRFLPMGFKTPKKTPKACKKADKENLTPMMAPSKSQKFKAKTLGLFVRKSNEQVIPEPAQAVVVVVQPKTPEVDVAREANEAILASFHEPSVLDARRGLDLTRIGAHLTSVTLSSNSSRVVPTPTFDEVFFDVPLNTVSSRVADPFIPFYAQSLVQESLVHLPSIFTPRRMCTADLIFRRILGAGGSGTVLLAEDKVTGAHLAIKAMWKHNPNWPQEAVVEEQVILRTLRNLQTAVEGVVVDGKKSKSKKTSQTPLVSFMTLEASWEDRDYFYVASPIAAGGALSEYANLHRCPSYETVVFWMASLIHHVERLHSYGYTHRDIKPDNILLMADGNVLLADFGLAVGNGGESNSGCGTTAFMSPEVLLGKTTNRDADLWAIAVTIYELVAGKLPWREGMMVDDERSLRELILEEKFIPGPELEDVEVDLLTKMFNKDVSQRPDIKAIKAHPYFKSIDWKKLDAGQIKPPFIPPPMDYSIDREPNFFGGALYAEGSDPNPGFNYASDRVQDGTLLQYELEEKERARAAIEAAIPRMVKVRRWINALAAKVMPKTEEPDFEIVNVWGHGRVVDAPAVAAPPTSRGWLGKLVAKIVPRRKEVPVFNMVNVQIRVEQVVVDSGYDSAPPTAPPTPTVVPSKAPTVFQRLVGRFFSSHSSTAVVDSTDNIESPTSMFKSIGIWCLRQRFRVSPWLFKRSTS